MLVLGCGRTNAL